MRVAAVLGAPSASRSAPLERRPRASPARGRPSRRPRVARASRRDPSAPDPTAPDASASARRAAVAAVAALSLLHAPWSAPGVARAAETTGSRETLERATEGRGATDGRGAARPPPAASASSDASADASVDSRRAAERVVDAFLALPREDQIDVVRRLAFPDASLPESSARAEETRRADERRGVADERDDDEKRYIETAGRSRPLASSDPLVGDDRGSSSAEDLDADLSARLADARDGWEAPSPSVAGFASNDSVETASSTPSPPSTLSRESSAAAFGGIRDLFENATREGEAVAASVASAALRVDGDVFVAGAFGALVLIAAASELASAAERSSRNESATTPRESAPPEEAEGEQRGDPVVGSRRREEGGARPTKAVASEGGVLWSRRRDDEANQGYGFGTDSEASSDDGVARAAPSSSVLWTRSEGAAARRGRRRAGGGARAAAEGDEGLRFDGRGAGRGKAGRFSYGSGSRRGSGRDRFGGLGPVEDENMEDVRMSPGSGTREAAPRR